MTRSHTLFAALCCTLLLTFAACKKSDSGGSTTGTGGTIGGTGGTVGAGGTVSGTGGTTAGGAGSSAPANMPNAQCLAGANHMNPACENCACTPNAMGGCLTELAACQGGTDAMGNMLCKAIIDCATMNKCAGTACTTPCVTQLQAASMYMMGAPLTAATNLGNCTSKSCSTVCP